VAASGPQAEGQGAGQAGQQGGGQGGGRQAVREARGQAQRAGRQAGRPRDGQVGRLGLCLRVQLHQAGNVRPLKEVKRCSLYKLRIVHLKGTVA
jgi:hypothetical protein